jgi:hypothetical protein
LLAACLADALRRLTETQGHDVEGRAKRAITQGDEIMSLIHVVIVLIVVGVLLWLVNRFIPMEGSIKSILNAVVIIAVVLWLLSAFGVFGSLSTLRVGK